MKNMNRALRRHQSETHKWRRLKEDWNQHTIDYSQRYPSVAVQHPDGIWHTSILWYEENLKQYGVDNVWIELKPVCPCYTDPRSQARFREQPKFDCHGASGCCKNKRKYYGLTLPEQINLINLQEGIDEYSRQSPIDHI